MSAQTTFALPAAWLGYKFGTEPMVRVCCECADRHEAEAEAARLKCRVTHTLCPRHFQERMAEITGEKL